MLEALKLVHFFGFILGIGGGVANAVAAAKLTGIPPEVVQLSAGFAKR